MIIFILVNNIAITCQQMSNKQRKFDT